MDITSILSRGVDQILPSSDDLSKLIQKRKIRVYLGIDPTGNQLHLGHSVVLRKLNQFAQAGHDVILLIGNGTVRIGDPTGRDSTRPMLTDAQIEENFQTWKQQAEKVLDFSKIRIVHNGDWLDKLTYADLVKLMAQTTIQQLIERDMFQERLKKELPIFGHEIMYPLLQGYDSVAMDVDLEIGGTDQTFNMMMGRHLQKTYNNKEKWVLSTPIINGTDGRKMGKSYNNFIGLTESPNEMFGKIMSIVDSQIVEYFTLLTDIPMHEIKKMKEEMEQGSNPLVFKKKLAFTITTMYHDASKASKALEHFEKTVQGGEVPQDVPTIIVRDTSMQLIDLVSLVRSDISRSEAKRLITQGAVEIDGLRKDQWDEVVTIENESVIKTGKRIFTKLSHTH